MIGKTNASGGLKINELIADFTVATGKTVTAGKFVEFVKDNYGTATVFNSATTSYLNAVLLNSTKVLVVYHDGGNSGFGTAQVLTISGTTVTIGAKTVITTTILDKFDLAVLSETSVCFIFYGSSTGGDSSFYSRILTISGTTVTAGTQYLIKDTNIAYVKTIPLSATSVFVCRFYSSMYFNILTISGTSISVGTEVSAGYSTNLSRSASISQLTTNTILLVGVDGSYLKQASVITISGTTITPSALTQITTSGNTHRIALTKASNNTAILFDNDGNLASLGQARILTISGTTVTAGTPIILTSNAISYLSACFIDTNRFLFTYSDSVVSKGMGAIITLNGTNLSIDGTTTFNENALRFLIATNLSANNILLSYGNVGNSNYGTAKVFQNVNWVKNAETKNNGLAKSGGTAGQTVQCYYNGL